MFISQGLLGNSFNFESSNFKNETISVYCNIGVGENSSLNSFSSLDLCLSTIGEISIKNEEEGYENIDYSNNILICERPKRNDKVDEFYILYVDSNGNYSIKKRVAVTYEKFETIKLYFNSYVDSSAHIAVDDENEIAVIPTPSDENIIVKDKTLKLTPLK